MNNYGSAKAIREFQLMRLEAYKRTSLKRPLTEAELKEFKALAKELHGIEISEGSMPSHL